MRQLLESLLHTTALVAFVFALLGSLVLIHKNTAPRICINIPPTDFVWAPGGNSPSRVGRRHQSYRPSSSENQCFPEKGLRPLKHRNLLGTLLEEHGFTTGAEVGVQRGEFSKILLDHWPSCSSFRLIDLWRPQENYIDAANVDQSTHNEFFEAAVLSLEKYKEKTAFMRMPSTEAAKRIDAESLDFVYIDARHDYCGAMEDFEAYWPLVAPGGVMAGHDYLSNDEIVDKRNDWSLCENGTRIASAIKGAVDDFFVPRGLTISIMHKEPDNSWMVQKPLC